MGSNQGLSKCGGSGILKFKNSFKASGGREGDREGGKEGRRSLEWIRAWSQFGQLAEDSESLFSLPTYKAETKVHHCLKGMEGVPGGLHA